VRHEVPIFNSFEKKAPRKRRTLRRFATFLIFIGLFTGILYGTASYMRGRGILPAIHNPFKARPLSPTRIFIFAQLQARITIPWDWSQKLQGPDCKFSE
jgi:hypothetical protein